MQGETKNVLIQDSRFVGGNAGILRYDKGFDPQDFVMRNVNALPDEPGPPIGWEHRGIKVYPGAAGE